MTINEVLIKNKSIIRKITSTKHPRSKRFPKSLKQKLISAIKSNSDELQIIKELEINKCTLHRWKESHSAKVAVRCFGELKVKDPSPISQTLTVVSPSGFKICGDYQILVSFIKEIEK